MVLESAKPTLTVFFLAEGYTSISVREPLSALRLEGAQNNVPNGESVGRHYTTVSDDSDDMYAAIEDPASESDTYAQIRPAPPSVDTLRAAVSAIPTATATSHSRQGTFSLIYLKIFSHGRCCQLILLRLFNR